MSNVAWSEVAPGVWRATVGEPEPFTPLSVVGCEPALAGLNELPQAPFPLPADSVSAEVGPRRMVVYLPLAEDEGIFGLGLQFIKVNHRGRTRYLRVNSDPQEDTGETHAPVPFYVSSKGYGVLVDTARIVTIYCGSCTRRDPRRPSRVDPTGQPSAPTPFSDSVEIALYAPGVNLYVFAGPTMLDVVRRYNLFCGGGPLPPRWGLGIWHRPHSWFTAQQVLAVAQEYRRRGLPCDVIGLEPGWQSGCYPSTFEWSPERFPEPAAFVRALTADRFRVNLWEHHYISPLSKLHPRLEPHAGSHTVWGGLVPDYTLDEPRRIVQEQHEKEHLALGISGYKLDECDGSELTPHSWIFPAHAAFPSGRDGEQMRQVYGLILQKLTYELFRRRDRRTYGLVRATTAGGVSLPYVLYSDLYDHRRYVRALCNAGFSGLLWTPEVRTADSPEEWVRRWQVVCFSPMALLNAFQAEAKMPWTYPEVEPIIRKYMQLRMRLLPYFYSAFARYHFDGTPPFRPMALEITSRPQAVAAEEMPLLAIDDQFMAGDSLLVAPLFTGETSRRVYLPEGAWYDFESGERFSGGQTITVSPGLEKIPVFVRDGGIIPLMPALPYAPQAGETVPLEIRHYGTAPGKFRLFDDDGETFAYERGHYRWIDLEVTIAPDGTQQGRATRPDAGWVSSYGEMTWRFIR